MNPGTLYRKTNKNIILLLVRRTGEYIIKHIYNIHTLHTTYVRQSTRTPYTRIILLNYIEVTLHE